MLQSAPFKVNEPAIIGGPTPPQTTPGAAASDRKILLEAFPQAARTTRVRRGILPSQRVMSQSSKSNQPKFVIAGERFHFGASSIVSLFETALQLKRCQLDLSAAIFWMPFEFPR